MELFEIYPTWPLVLKAVFFSFVVWRKKYAFGLMHPQSIAIFWKFFIILAVSGICPWKVSIKGSRFVEGGRI